MQIEERALDAAIEAYWKDAPMIESDREAMLRAITAYEAAKAPIQPAELCDDKIMLEKQNAFLAQFKDRGWKFMLAATAIYQRAWETALETGNKKVELNPSLHEGYYLPKGHPNHPFTGQPERESVAQKLEEKLREIIFVCTQPPVFWKGGCTQKNAVVQSMAEKLLDKLTAKHAPEDTGCRCETTSIEDEAAHGN